MATQTEADVGQKGGKYLTFGLAQETYGLEILKVREIMGLMDITAVPRTPDFVKGVINLRGKVTILLDISKVLAQREIADLPSAKVQAA